MKVVQVAGSLPLLNIWPATYYELYYELSLEFKLPYYGYRKLFGCIRMGNREVVLAVAEHCFGPLVLTPVLTLVVLDDAGTC